MSTRSVPALRLSHFPLTSTMPSATVTFWAFTSTPSLSPPGDGLSVNRSLIRQTEQGRGICVYVLTGTRGKLGLHVEQACNVQSSPLPSMLRHQSSPYILLGGVDLLEASSAQHKRS